MSTVLMESLLTLYLLYSLLLLLPLLPSSSSFPLCTNSWAPKTLKTPLTFCSYTGSSCCNATDDAALQKQFSSMNISDSTCGSIVKSILCTKCNPYSADLFTTEPNIQMVPVLCNSTSSITSSQSSKVASGDFCTQVWDSCKDVSIRNSPFAASLQGRAGTSVSSSRLSDLWQSETDFCKAFGGSAGSESVCFDGQSASFNSTADSAAPKGICLEKLGNGSYLSMVPHPDGSNRVFLSDQAGKIWLAKVPAAGSGGTLDFNESSTFLDITDMVHYDTAFGVMGLAFHPNFKNNGRFFVSYNCDKTQTASCSGRCSCNSDVDCDPSKLGLSDGAQPCRYQSVISEFTVNGSSVTPSEASFAAPSEVRRIFTMGLPYSEHHGGQILFGPEDGYLYFMMGDGGNDGDPFNFAQNKKSLLGKIMRLDVNNIPSSSEIIDLGLWGNYSIPEDNPYAEDSELQAEIWAVGLRNPWRCSFDASRPSYFYCGDVGQEAYEEVDLISKGGNYGWRVYEGPYLYKSKWTPGGNTSLSSINPISPVMGYNHSSVNTNVGSASISGGYVYRAKADPCLYGRYLYADLYGLEMWAGMENPKNSGNYNSSALPFDCAKNTPIACDPVEGSRLPSLGIVYSFAEDNERDVYLLASKGVYRIVRPSLCNYSCPQEKYIDNGAPPPGSPSSSSTCLSGNLLMKLILLLVCLIFLLSCY
ncbi:HIPL1 protein-like [Phalaenopsis equestris]|uniref:HIPL1 protein-like n=1 Tax=Phalaenopsis equestris TaxID=78828 RepID=UPI0009E65B32|nr:HIPL1 protein-like [Phalaenopsis equestris]